MSYIYVPQTVITKKNLHQMAEGKDKKPTNLNKQLSDSDTSDDEPINPKLKSSVEERDYRWYNTRLNTSHSSSSQSFACTSKPTVE